MGSPLRHFLKPCDVRPAQNHSRWQLGVRGLSHQLLIARPFPSQSRNSAIVKVGRGWHIVEQSRPCATAAPQRVRDQAARHRRGTEGRHNFHIVMQLFLRGNAPAKAATLVFRMTIERRDHEVDQLCHSPPRMSQCQERSCPNGGHRIVTKRMALRSRL